MLGRFTLPENFQRELLFGSWHQQAKSWQSPFETPYATEETAFRCLSQLHHRMERGNTKILPRFYVEGEQRGLLFDPHLPKESDQDMSGYERRLLALFGDKKIGMVVPDVQCLDEKLWFHAISIARTIFGTVGFPAGGSYSEIFFGNYTRSFFGLHKDQLETLTFVVRGRKRFLVWPFEVFAKQPGVPENGARKQIHFGSKVDYEPYRDKAIILEGGPGDVFFWPASYWHVAESDGEDFCTTFTLAFFSSATRSAGAPFRLADEAESRAAVDGFDTIDPPYPPVHTTKESVATALKGLDACLARHTQNPAIIAARRELGLAWLSGYGFKERPEEGLAKELGASDLIETDEQNPVLWADETKEGFPCAINGIILMALPKFLPLVEHLNQGGQFLVGDLLGRFITSQGDDPLTQQDILDALSQLGAARFFRVVT